MFDYRGLHAGALLAAGLHRGVRGLLHRGAAAVRRLAAAQLCRPGAQAGVAEPGAGAGALRHLRALHVEHGRDASRVSLAAAHGGHRGVPGVARRDAAGALRRRPALRAVRGDTAGGGDGNGPEVLKFAI